ncbi:DUF4073 domain-containing protein [Ornithinimicrobium cavernae]|uniref:DUF4073 domain-containing protein n=1 Tax=Ornithinimicrobium cavernae TaxID=2666047 RepID=UPI000D68A08F|nr:DUF4073 domain-containing protein [Ornithinimicrobium cavernae]
MSRHRATTAVAAALLPLTLVGAAAAPADDTHRPHPVTTTRHTDDVIFREGFNGLAKRLEPRADDPGIAEGTLGFTHRAPVGWSVEVDESMEDTGVTEWRGWSFTTREFWTDAEDQMRFRFGRADDIVAVADSDEFADRGTAPHDFSTSLVSAPVRVKGEDELQLSFDSHYRGWTGQSATVTVSFDGGEEIELMRYDSATVTDNYDGSRINATELLDVTVPAGAKDAVFRWDFEAEANSWYWAIDSVAVHRAPDAGTTDATTAWVVSDIQGQPGDLSHALQDLQTLRPGASGLLMVGDIVASGTQAQWDEVNAVMEASAGILPDQVVAAIGNHESYTGGAYEDDQARFLEFAQRDRTWGEYLLEGTGGDLPVIVLGQDAADPPDVPMSEEQIAFLEDRLAHWTRQDKQVVVISHFPLGDTHSASWIPWYHDHYQFNDRLTGILGDYPNAIVLNGHTHYPAELGDWAVQRRTDGGHPDGFWAINTLAIQVEWDARGENTDGISEVVTRDINRGLVLDSFGDRVVVQARDFAADELIRSVTIPNPLD